MHFPEVISLNVGGRHFTTLLSTLTKYPDSMLAAMFSGRHHVPQDKDGRYFVDVDGDIFAYVLQFLRFQKPPPPEIALAVLEYAEYFGLCELKTALSDYMPVRAVPLYGRVRSGTHGYSRMLSQIKDDLFTNDILSLSIFIIVKSGNKCQPFDPKTGQTRQLQHQFSSFQDYRHIHVNTRGQNDRLLAVAATLVHDLKAIGTHPEDEVIYRPDPLCQCTVGRKVRLIV